MVGPSAPRRDQLVTQAAREWKVGDPIAVEMAELATAKPKFDPPEAMWSDLDPIP
jgi:hypothetical protein